MRVVLIFSLNSQQESKQVKFPKNVKTALLTGMIQRSDDGHEQLCLFFVTNRSTPTHLVPNLSVCHVSVHHPGLALNSVTASHRHSNRQNN